MNVVQYPSDYNVQHPKNSYLPKNTVQKPENLTITIIAVPKSKILIPEYSRQSVNLTVHCPVMFCARKALEN
jgi:hypothetical protein